MPDNSRLSAGSLPFHYNFPLLFDPLQKLRRAVCPAQGEPLYRITGKSPTASCQAENSQAASLPDTGRDRSQKVLDPQGSIILCFSLYPRQTFWGKSLGCRSIFPICFPGFSSLRDKKGRKRRSFSGLFMIFGRHFFMEKHLKSGVFQSLFLQMHTISGFHYSTLTIYPSLRGLGCGASPSG